MPSCPQCKVSLVNQVPRRGRLEYLLSILSIGPFRCQLCTHRFLGLKWRPSTNPGREYNRIQTRCAVRLTPNLRGRTTGAEGDHIQQEEATLFDISIRGCGIKTNAPLHKGDLVRMEIEMTPQQKPLRIDEAVVRTLTGRRFGLEFVNIRDEELTHLRTLLVELTHGR